MLQKAVIPLPAMGAWNAGLVTLRRVEPVAAVMKPGSGQVLKHSQWKGVSCGMVAAGSKVYPSVGCFPRLC